MFNKKEYCKQWRIDNPDYGKQYYQANKEKNKERGKQWYYNNIEKCSERSRKYRLKNIDKKKEYDRLRHKENKDKERIQHKKWLKEHPNYNKEWKQKNKDKIKKSYNQEYHNHYEQNKYKTNPKFRLNKSMRWMIWNGLKKEKSGKRWLEFVDYSLNDLVKHLEKQFTVEMNWENYGSYWVIDHIIPRKVFNFTKPEHEDFKRCWDLRNLRPLITEENLKKGGKLSNPFQPSLKI